MSNSSQTYTSAKKTDYDYILGELGAKDIVCLYMPEVPEHQEAAIYLLKILGYRQYQKNGETIARALFSKTCPFYCQAECDNISDEIFIYKILAIVDSTLDSLNLDHTDENRMSCAKSILPSCYDRFISIYTDK